MCPPLIVDWTAAGSWAQAFAGLAGAGAVLYAAHKGANSFGQWLEQRQAEQRMSVAERALSAAYAAEMAFPAIRARMLWAGELMAAERTLKESGALHEDYDGRAVGEKDPRLQRLVTTQVVIDRLNEHSELWRDILTLMPVAKAYFGPGMSAALRSFLTQRHFILTAAEMHVDDDESIRAKINADLWGQSDGSDEVSTALKQALKEIEAIALPALGTVNEGTTRR